MKILTALWIFGTSFSWAFLPLTNHCHGSWHHTHRDLGKTTCFSSQRTLVDIRESSARDIPSLDNWATACGVQRSDGFQLTSEDGYDTFVTTQSDLAAGTPVLFVPSEMILSSNQIIQEYGRLQEAESELQSFGITDQMRQFYLMVKILVEYEKGDESPWFPWLNSLPRFFTNGASMTTFCFECLPPLAALLALRERTNMNSMELGSALLPNNALALSDVASSKFMSIFK